MHAREKDVLFQNALRISLAPTPRKEPFHVMFVQTYHTQEEKKQKVCDWIHLSLSVAVPARPALKRDRDLELSQPHFSTQTKTFEHEGQNATKITSALVHSISLACDVDVGEKIVSVLGSYDIFLSVFHFFFLSQLCDHVVIKTDWCSHSEQMDTESWLAPGRPLP